MNSNPEADAGGGDGAPPELDPGQIVAAFAYDFAAAEALADRAWTYLPAQWPGTYAECIIIAIFCRATLTYRAIISLCRFGYQRQAMMLSRSLFGDMVVAHWVHSKPDEASRRFQRHNDSSIHRYNKLLTQSGINPGRPIHLDQEQLAELERLFGKYHEKHWTGRSVRQLVSEIEPLWDYAQRAAQASTNPDSEVADDRDQLRWYFHTVYSESNQYLHSTSRAIGSAAYDDLGRRTQSPRDAAKALRTAPTTELACAFWSYGSLCGLRAGISGGLEEELAFSKWFWEIEAGFVSARQRRETRRNEPCPCGSGLKFKRCHGALPKHA